MINRTYKIFLDLDGVICAFEKQYANLSGGLTIKQYSQKYGDKKARNLFLKAGFDFWTRMDWEIGGQELYHTAKSLFSDVRILSSTGTSDENYAMTVERGKKEWLIKHIPEISYDKIYIVRGKHWKKCYATNLSILIDDAPDTIDEWNKEGGIGIFHNSSDYKDSIEKLKEIAKT